MADSESRQFLLRKVQRLRTADEFRLCYKGVRAGDSHLLIFAVTNDLSRTRVGVSVSKKHGNAVARNRKKRLLREAFRQLQHQLSSGMDLVLVPRQRPDSTLNDYQSSLRQLTDRLSRRLIRKATQPAERNPAE